MNYFKALVWVIVIVGLSACASVDIKNDVAPVDWGQQQEALSQLNRWTIKGRISVQTEYQGGQVDYTWRQINKTDYDIRLQAPMGAGTTVITARDSGISLHTSSGGFMFDTDIDKLMRKLNGWPLPVSGLRYWVRGMPAPDSDYEVRQWSVKGGPQVMLQDGWRIEFKKYNMVSGNMLPGKLFINRINGEEVDVRLIIRQWILGPSLN